MLIEDSSFTDDKRISILFINEGKKFILNLNLDAN